MNKIYAYDAEVVPNYASFTFIDIEPYLKLYNEIRDEDGNLIVPEQEKIDRIKGIKPIIFEISSVEGYEIVQLVELINFVSQNDYLAGFNSVSYDDLLLKFLSVELMKFKTVADINKKLYEFSKWIVETDNGILSKDPKFNMYKWYNVKFASIDVQKIPALDKVFKGLKQTLINLSWFSINEFELPPIDQAKEGKYYPNVDPAAYPYIKKWDRYLIKEFIEPMKEYNLNDVYGTCELFCFLKKQINLRFDLNYRYDLNTLCASDSKIADIFISKYYSEYTGIDYKEYKDLRTYRGRMNIGKIISPLIHFKTVTFNKLLHNLLNTTVTSTDEIKYAVTFNGVTYDIKSGGLHSRDLPNQYYYPNGSNIIEDGDVGSYYPTLTQNMRVAPKHLIKEAFLEVTKIMVNDRLKAKAEGDMVVANSLKITINVGLFGKFNFAYSFLFDTLCTLTITINGQLTLLMLVERLALAGIPNVSANTDGIVCIIPKDKLDLYYEICNAWAKEVNFLFEYTRYVKYFRLDVNNYITVKQKKDGTLDVKRKGRLNQHLCTEDLKKGFDKPIVAKAVEEYFINNVPVNETVYNERNVYLFCITQNISKDFTPVFRHSDKNVEDVLQHTNRFYASTNGGYLFKRDGDGPGKYSYTGILAGQLITVFNDYFACEDFSDYNIDYRYYIKEIEGIIRIIESGMKAKTKKEKRIQELRVSPKLFDDETLDQCISARRDETLELAKEDQIVKVPESNLKDSIPVDMTLSEEDEKYAMSIDGDFGIDPFAESRPITDEERQAVYDNAISRDSFTSSPPTGEDAKNSNDYTCDDDEDDLPF